MKKKLKGQAELMRRLLADLRYWQMNGRIYRRWVRDANDKCEEIAMKMREIQNENKKTIPTRLHDDGVQIQREESRV